MFIATNKIPVSAEHQEHMKQAFQKNAPSLKEVPGFLNFELWTTDEALVSVSKWESKEAFNGYVQSDLFREHHGSGQHAFVGKPEITNYSGEVLV